MSQSKADGSHHGDEMQLEHTAWSMMNKRRHDNQQTVFRRVSLADVVNYRHMLRLCFLQIVRTLISHLQKQSCWLTIDESKDALVHVLDITCHRPIETLLKRVECPQPSIVALSGDDRMGTNEGSHHTSQVIGSSHMTTEHGDDVLSKTVHTHHSRIRVLILNIWRNRSHTNAHSPDEDESIKLLPFIAHFRPPDGLGSKLVAQRYGNILSCLANLYNGYPLHTPFMTKLN